MIGYTLQFHVTDVVGIISRHCLSIKAYLRDQPDKTSLASAV